MLISLYPLHPLRSRFKHPVHVYQPLDQNVKALLLLLARPLRRVHPLSPHLPVLSWYCGLPLVDHHKGYVACTQPPVEFSFTADLAFLGPELGFIIQGGLKTGLIIAGVVWTVFALIGLLG